MKTILYQLPKALLLLLFVYAAGSKLLNLQDFRAGLFIQPLPANVAAVLFYALPAGEIAAAFLLLFPKSNLAGLQLSLSLLLLFSGYILLVLLNYWDRVPCPCGGILGHMPWGLHLGFNGCFICINLAALHIHFKERRAVTGMKD